LFFQFKKIVPMHRGGGPPPTRGRGHGKIMPRLPHPDDEEEQLLGDDAPGGPPVKGYYTREIDSSCSSSSSEGENGDGSSGGNGDGDCDRSSPNGRPIATEAMPLFPSSPEKPKDAQYLLLDTDSSEGENGRGDGDGDRSSPTEKRIATEVMPLPPSPDIGGQERLVVVTQPEDLDKRGTPENENIDKST